MMRKMTMSKTVYTPPDMAKKMACSLLMLMAHLGSAIRFQARSAGEASNSPHQLFLMN